MKDFDNVYKLFKKKIVSWHNRAFIIFMKYTLNNYKIQLNFVLLYEPKYVNIYNFLIKSTRNNFKHILNQFFNQIL